jgi:5-methylcytosine-specific restriction endonuclease McrA
MRQTSALEALSEINRLLQDERNSLVAGILALSRFDRDKYFVDIGYPSFWAFLTRELKLSEALAYSKMTAARMVQEFPQVVGPLRDGSLCITHLVKLAKVMTEENCQQLLDEATGKSTRAVEKMVAREDPKPERRNVMRKMPTVATEQSMELPLGPPPTMPPPPSTSEVLSEDTYRLHWTVDEDLQSLLEQTRAALSHTMPGASEVDLLKEAMRRVVKESAKRKGLTDKPRPPKEPTPRPDWERHPIPARVRREVWTRDEGKCQEPLATGGTCGATELVQFAHLVDDAKGGPPTASNLSLRCSFHNRRAAEASFGAEHVRKKIESRRRWASADRKRQAELPWRTSADRSDES